VFVVCQGLQGDEPVGIEKSLEQRIVTVVVEIGSHLVYFVSVVGEIGSRLVCPLQKAQAYWKRGDIGFLRSR
jgi:hypothetical protein